MSPANQFDKELKVGIFVSLGAALLMISILVLGSAENLLSSTAHYSIHLMNTDGLIVGAKVVLNGVNIGTVDKINFDNQAHDVQIRFSVSKDAGEWIREDSVCEIATQGLLGDKFVSISAGSRDKPKLENNAVIQVQSGKSLSQFITQGDQLMASLNNIASSLDRVLKSFEADNQNKKLFQGLASTAQNLAQTTDKLNHELESGRIKKILSHIESITEKIDSGTGTLGAVINDPELYDSAKSLMGEANRNRIVRNLVRQSLKDADQKAATQK